MEVPIYELKTNVSKILNKVAESGKAVYVTRHGKIIAKIVPFSQEEAWEEAKKRLAGSVLKYEKPTEPVGEEDWEALNDPA